MKDSILLVTLTVICFCVCPVFVSAGPEASVGDYDIVWDTPGKGSADSMPLGNGDIGLNVWTEPNGDVLFYISKTDAWGDNSRLLKVGRVRVHVESDVEMDAGQFEQRLDLQSGVVRVRYGKVGKSVGLIVWVDANNPVIHVACQSTDAFKMTVSNEPWRLEAYELESIEVSDVHLDRTKTDSKHAPTIVEADTILKDQKGMIGWYHHNAKSVGPELTMGIQDLDGFDMVDPILHRTFGAVITGEDAERIDDLTLTTKGETFQRVSIHVLTAHPSTPSQWQEEMDKLIERTEKTSFGELDYKHGQWWSDFWKRSWIFARQNRPGKISVIKPSRHPVRVGEDQGGGNKYKGEIGRVNIFDRAVADKEILSFSKTDRDKGLGVEEEVLYSSSEVKTGAISGSDKWDIEGGITLEAWVKPEKLGGGGARIIDKITPGGDDGFLLDTFPGNSLRFITKAGTIGKQGVLSEGKWSHVAATAGEDGLSLFLNGQKIAQQPMEAGQDAFVVTRGYVLQRFINACAGRGAYPIKFNGTIFTVDHNGDPDYRRWGPGYWWQNTRLPYVSMTCSGDYDLMAPLFKMYAGDVFEVSKYRTQRYFGHAGAYYPECIYFWGAVFSESYGWQPAKERADKLQESGWHKWEFVSGLEVAWMMLDYYEHTLDEEFLVEKTIPVANEVIAFFENYYETGDDGKLVMHPSQAVETWWNCTNPMPEVAGLIAVTQKLIGLPEGLTSSKDRAYWKALAAKLPTLPTREVDGIKMLAPAEKFADKRNIENPELYAVFPFRLVSLDKDNVKLGIEALNRRWDKGSSGWRQDDVFMAYLGLAEQARKNLVSRARSSHGGSRFPAFWGPNYDWVPDQDHGGILLKAFQSMLMQTDGRKIILLPAWPEDWDAEFKLHAPYKTTVSGAVRNGKVVSLRVLPASRRKDVVVMEAQ